MIYYRRSKFARFPTTAWKYFFSKQRQGACRIQKRIAVGEWTIMETSDYSPVTDHAKSPAGNPEQRDYRAIYTHKGQIVGQYSPVVTVVTTP